MSKIFSEMRRLVSEYEHSLLIIEGSYLALLDVRSSFPSKFLTKESIVLFINKMSRYNKQKFMKLESEIKDFEDSAKKYQIVYKDPSCSNKKEIKDKLRVIKSKLEILNLEKKRKVKIEVDSSPERVRYFYEDLLLFTSLCKDESLEIWRFMLSIDDELDVKIDYYSSIIYLEESESYLKNLGFHKITQKEREAYLNSRVELKDLKLLKGKALALKNSSKRLVDFFESSEVNFRKFVERIQQIN